MATRAESIPAWQRGRVASWLVTTDHKRIGILYISTSVVFLVLAGLMALVMRTQLAQANEDLISAEHYNELVTIHGTTMVFLVGVPVLAGFANYLVPLMIGAEDMAFPRLNALSYWFYFLGGAVLMLSFFADGGAGASGLDALSAALGASARERHRLPDPVAAPAHGLDGGRSGELSRDDPQPANARDVVDADAALRLVDRALLVADHGRDARAVRGAHAAPPGPRHLDRAVGRADALLQPGRGRIGAPLPARVLVLRPPRGVRHRAAGVRDHQRGPARLRPQADLRLQGDRRVDGRDRVLLDARVGAPHVHGGTADPAPGLVHDRVDDHRRADRDEDLQLARDPVARQRQLRDADALRARVPLALRHRRVDRHLSRRLPDRLAGARQLLRRRALPLHPARRRRLRGLRGPLLLVAEDVRAEARTSGSASGSSGSSSSASTSRSCRSTSSGSRACRAGSTRMGTRAGRATTSPRRSARTSWRSPSCSSP